MAKCECGCGSDAGGRQFLPGHDQRLRTALEAGVGGLLPLRTLVRAAQAYLDGTLSDQAFTQTVRSVFSGAEQQRPGDPGRRTCRQEILECAEAVTRETGREFFTIAEIIDCMANRGSLFAESTIRTHIASRMCENAPDNHAVTYKELERSERGEYRLIR